MKQQQTAAFTLIEVAVSLAILALALASMLQLLSSARLKMSKSMDAWRKTHALCQGAEYFLLHEEDVEAVPYQFFPYNQYQIIRTYDEISDEEIPEDYTGISGQLELKACTIQLLDSATGQLIDSVTVDRISYDDSLKEQ